MMASIQATKEKLVDELLTNSVYMPESGVYQRLRAQLLRLSKDDLGCLRMIWDIKAMDALTENPTDGQVRQLERGSEEWAKANPGAVMRAEREESERQQSRNKR